MNCEICDNNTPIVTHHIYSLSKGGEDKVVKQIEKEISDLNKVKDQDKRAKMKKKLEKELKKWKKRETEYKERLYTKDVE